MAQNYSNHRQWVPIYHFILSLMVLATTIGAGINFFKTMGGAGFYSGSLIFITSLSMLITFFLFRAFALKAQDRAIRAEENLRHFAMTGKLLDSKLTTRQIIGLRFASDDEFQELAKKAVSENMSENDIKKAVKNWKPDTYRA